MTTIDLAHDYLTQRGGAERVALLLARTFSGAPLHTALYEQSSTFPGFAEIDVRPLWLNAVRPLRQRHRLALPLLAPTFTRLHLDADVALCSSSGWAHLATASNRKVVYCHNVARWLYQPTRYGAGDGLVARTALRALRPALLRADERGAHSATTYIANSSVTRERIESAYGIDAEVLHPPPALTPGAMTPADREPGYLLSVNRLLPYKNVSVLVDAFRQLPAERLVVAGDGPQLGELRSAAPTNVTFVGAVDDERLRRLYQDCRALVTAAYEDFGLTPLEANSFGKPAVTLRFGGFLDTIEHGITGLLVESPTATEFAHGVTECGRTSWDERALKAHAGRYSADRFVERIKQIVEEA